MRIALRSLALLLVALLLYLALWPTRVEPVAWQAPPSEGLTGAFASNGKLAAFELLAPTLTGPEAITADALGQLYTGTLDGQVVRLDPNGNGVTTLARTGGRPLGLKVLPDGTLAVADAYEGLLHVRSDGSIAVLADRHGGARFACTDDLDVLPDGRIVFSDATARFALDEYELDALEHSSTGRLLAYDPRTRQVSELAGGLAFANGVAAAPDGSFVLVNETWAFRVTRVWLAGPRAGQRETLVDNLPAFPDNITYDRTRDLFWVALASPRDAPLDALAPYPIVRKMIARLPKAMRPAPKRHAAALAIRGDGRIVAFVDDPRPSSYSPVTSVLGTKDALFLGSLSQEGIARVNVDALGIPALNAR